MVWSSLLWKCTTQNVNQSVASNPLPKTIETSVCMHKCVFSLSFPSPCSSSTPQMSVVISIPPRLSSFEEKLVIYFYQMNSPTRRPREQQRGELQNIISLYHSLTHSHSPSLAQLTDVPRRQEYWSRYQCDRFVFVFIMDPH